MSARASRSRAGWRGGVAATIGGLGCVLLLARSANGQPAPADATTPVSDAGSQPVTQPATGDAGTPPSEPAPPAPAPAAQPPSADAGTPKASTSVIAATGAVEMARFRYANTWDLNLEGGGGYVLGGVDKWTGFVRARPGVLIVRNDDFYQLGVTAEYLGLLRRPAFGVQAEYLNLQLGAWIQLGGSIDTKGRPGGNLGVGLSIFGIEGQVREFDQVSDPAFAVIGKIRLPLGILIYGLQNKK